MSRVELVDWLGRGVAVCILIAAAGGLVIVAFPKSPTQTGLAVAVREVSLEDYAPLVASCSVAVYAVARYVVVDAAGVGPEQLRQLTPALQRLTADFAVQLGALGAVNPNDARLHAGHRAVVARFIDLEAWSRDVTSAFVTGDPDALLRQEARGRGLLDDLKVAYRALADEAAR